MDYEKEYKEALERAKEYHEADPDNTMMVHAKGIMEHLFPQLKVVKEEDIIKVLKELVDATPEGDFYDATKKECVNWLEKQKKEKTWPNLSNCIHDCKKCDGKCFYRKEPREEINKPVEWPKESIVRALTEELTKRATPLFKKNLESSINDWEKGSLDTLVNLRSYVNSPAFEIGTYSEWTEEDERNKYELESILFYDKELPEETRDRLKTWLKSLHLKYKQDDFDRGYAVGASAEKYNQWKPNPDQMAALSVAINKSVEMKEYSVYEELNSLYNDLRKIQNEK